MENDTVNRHGWLLAAATRRGRDTDKWNISKDLIRGNGVWSAGDTSPAPALTKRKVIACLETPTISLFLCVSVCFSDSHCFPVLTRLCHHSTSGGFTMSTSFECTHTHTKEGRKAVCNWVKPESTDHCCAITFLQKRTEKSKRRRKKKTSLPSNTSTRPCKWSALN